MKRNKWFIASFIVFICMQTSAQTDLNPSGKWKGTSICQVKNSPCHDEQVVYLIKRQDSLNRYQMTMSKIINGSEEEMGTLQFSFDPATHVLVSEDTSRQARWEFLLKNLKMTGTLIYQNKLYRKIEADKIN